MLRIDGNRHALKGFLDVSPCTLYILSIVCSRWARRECFYIED